MLFDSHAHLNYEKHTQEKVEELAAEIEASDVSYVMDVGFDLESSAAAIRHAHKYPWCYAAVGIHPHEAKKVGGNDMAILRMLAKKPRVQALGEIGLDYYYEHSKPWEQQDVFREQIQLANELKMPIVVHSREADQDTLDILKEEQAFSDERRSWFPMRNEKPDARVLLHCFSGSREIAEQYVKLGATISIAGPITYKNARVAVEVVKAIPIEYLLIETDAPYLTPEPGRSKKNKSPNVELVARKIAEIKEMTYEEVAKITCENAKRFFRIES